MLQKGLKRLRRHFKIRATVIGTASRPRLSIYRSNANIYAQLIDDSTGTTIGSVSDLKMKKDGTKVEMSQKVVKQLQKLLVIKK